MSDVATTCPHCQGPTHGVSHFTSTTKALDLGRRLCPRGGGRIARGEYWGWACPADHTCHQARMPPLPEPDIT